jgi:hypothetical protein
MAVNRYSEPCHYCSDKVMRYTGTLIKDNRGGHWQAAHRECVIRNQNEQIKEHLRRKFNGS